MEGFSPIEGSIDWNPPVYLIHQDPTYFWIGIALCLDIGQLNAALDPSGRQPIVLRVGGRERR